LQAENAVVVGHISFGVCKARNRPSMGGGSKVRINRFCERWIMLSLARKFDLFVVVAVFLVFFWGCSKNPSAPQSMSGTIVDIDGNVYHTVTIGTQVWMVENLKTTRFNDGVAIPLVTDSSAWSNLAIPGYCWYNNNSAAHEKPYGALYNWYAVNTGKLAPTGWHVPSDSEWINLFKFENASNPQGSYDSLAGGPLKDSGTRYWASPNAGATNSSGFSALPGGYRFNLGTFYQIDSTGYWWSSTNDLESVLTGAWHCEMNWLFPNAILGNLYSNGCGFSVRCLKNN
jgi:uncharacterized protein (TIGR02145 family)